MIAEGAAGTATESLESSGESESGLLAAARSVTEGQAAATESLPDLPPSVRPPDIPEQFWDAVKSVPRNEEIVKSWKSAVADRDRLKQAAAQTNDPAPDVPEKYLAETLFKDGKLILGEKTASWGEIPKDDPILTGFAAACHEQGIGQKQFANLLPKIMEHLAPKLPPPVDVKAELAALDGGVEGRGQQMIDAVSNWVNRQQGHGELSSEEAEYINSFCRDAFGVRVFAKIIKVNGLQPIPTGPSLDPNKSLSADEYKTLAADPRMFKDASYTDRVLAMGRRIFPEG